MGTWLYLLTFSDTDTFPTLFLLTYQLQCHKRILDLEVLRNGIVEMSAVLGPILQSSWQTTASVSALAGVLSHHTVFRRYEIDGNAWDLVFAYIGLFIALCIGYVQIAGLGLFASLCRLSSTDFDPFPALSWRSSRASTYYGRWPRPTEAAKISRGYIRNMAPLFELVRKATPAMATHSIRALAKRLIPATGPRELSINLPPAIPLIYGWSDKITKSPWYGQVSNDITEISLNSTRDPKAHKERKFPCSHWQSFYHLAKNPDCYQALQDAMWQHFPNGGSEWTYEKVRAVPYLDWVINESLRLRPPVPGGLTRVTPPEGLWVDDVFIPGDTVISVPTYTMQRDENYWSDALSFKPERWKGLSTKNTPYIPFTRGQGYCPGEPLAMMEMRMVVGLIALRYNISFPEGVDAKAVELPFEDYFTQKPGPLHLVFTPASR
uniref:Cytochrome P450 n=1 Tax=Gibberella zeae TaxID=5518 RepID=A0A4E9EM58_GIBZA